MISVKIYKQGKELLVAACDVELLGKKFEEGKFQLDVKKEFYGGKLITHDVLKNYLEDATIANLVGHETIKCAIKAKIINPKCVIKIKEIPHAQMVRMLP